MIPGPTYVYQCPNCGNPFTRGSLMSANVGLPTKYSDGKGIFTGYPEIPDQSKCKKCDTIFLISELDEIDLFFPGAEGSSKWEGADMADFLDVDDCFRLLADIPAENSDEELSMRVRIWRRYNDRIRNGENLFVDENDEVRWTENCHKLLSFLNPSDLNDKIMSAEIHRNLGDFDTCLRMMESLKDEDLEWVKVQFIRECEKKNRWVIKLSTFIWALGLKPLT